jgi:hypothetical protein
MGEVSDDIANFRTRQPENRTSSPATIPRDIHNYLNNAGWR